MTPIEKTNDGTSSVKSNPTELDKLIENGGWRPILEEDPPVSPYDLGDSNYILFKNENNGVFLGYTQRVSDKGYRCFAVNTGDYHDGGYGNAYLCGKDSDYDLPTHFMLLDTTERMAAVIKVLAKALDVLDRNGISDSVAKEALAKANEIAGGSDYGTSI